ncbi:MAG: substrate-binding domain-containing protein [Betaproteobacteria bacterium]
MATRHVLATLAADYACATGQDVAIESVGGVDAARRVRDGEAFDVVVLAANAIEQLAAAGCVDPDSRVDIARSGVAIAVAAGARQPDIGSAAATRDAILAARSVGVSTGPSGAHLTRLLERWGIADIVAPRIAQAPPGVPVAALVARGDAELGFQQLSELVDMPGVEVVGALPSEIQESTVFAGAVCTTSARPAAAAALLAFLASPAAAAAKHRHGMEPA